MSSETKSPLPADPNAPADPTTAAPGKKKAGRKVGYRKAPDLSNGLVSADKIFLFVDRDTVPVNDLTKFLRICDTWIKDLGPETLKDTDLEEIALYARERVYIDGVYKGFAEAETIDPNLITQLEKMNKGLEARKENLGSRFKDRGIQRKDKSKFSFINLFESFEEDSQKFMRQGTEKDKIIEDNKENYTSTEEYMEGHIISNSNTPPTEEEGS
jgi:hypothetical protein